MSFLTQKLKWCFTCRDSVRVPMNAEERGAVPGNVPYWGANSIQDYVRDSLFNEELVLLGEDGAPFFDPLRDVAFRVNGPIWPNNHVHVLQPKKHVDARYMAYALNSHVDYSLYVGGATRDKLTQGAMDTIELPCPEKKTQTAIANYLDRKTAAIDALIEKKERLIEEVRKYQEAVIAEAVAPREGWMEVFARRLIKEVKRGKAKSSDVLFEGECCSVPYLTPESIQNNSFFASSENKIPESMASYGRGDVAFCNIASVGKCGLITEDAGGSPQILGFSASSLVTPEFLLLLLRSRRKEFLLSATSSVVPYLPLEMILNTKFHVPEMEVQCEIYEFVNSKMLNSEKVIQVAEETLRNLKLLRSAMISEAVTGKLPVPADIQ